MRRRAFIAGLAGATVLPVAARAQPSIPVIGFLGATSSEAFEDRLRGLRMGLKETGFIDGENVAIDFRWADGQYDRLPALVADLVRRRVAMIVTSGGTAPVLAAKAATATIPIAFLIAEDPAKLGLVATIGRPGSNVTGINFLNSELGAKRLELLRDLVPGIVRVAVLVNPANTSSTQSTVSDVEAAAPGMGLQIRIVRAGIGAEIEAAFADFAHARPDALFVGPDAMFAGRRVQLALLAARHAIPTMFATRFHPEAGGLMSYGADIVDAFRQLGVYAGRILKDAKPADLPVVQSTKLELVINLQAARVLGLTIPHSLLARADAVIE